MESLQKTYEKLTPENVIAESVKQFGAENLALACSFSAEDVMLIDLIQKSHPEIEVFTLDTGRLPKETYELWEQLLEKYPKLKIVPYFPDAQKLEEFITKNGPSAFLKNRELRKECCDIRKVDGLKRAIECKKAWLTGLRSEQSDARKGIQKIEPDTFFPDKFKISPLADVSQKEVFQYLKKNKVPQSELYKKGYSSIGCDPCTRAVTEGETERSGRWWWESADKKECGLHPEFLDKKTATKKKKSVEVEINSKHLDQLENESIFIIREAYKKLGKIGMLWSIGKDSCVMLHLMRKAFFGNTPIPLVHVDTGYKIPEMIKFRDEYTKKWNLKLIVHRNEAAIKAGMNPEEGRLVCCKALKTDPLKEIIEKEEFTGVIAGIRRDEEGSRSKERYFSPRGNNSNWDYKNQPPEFWNQFKTDFGPDVHIRVHPILHWNEVDIWEYIKRENIPMVDLYFAKNGKRYRSLGCAPCTGQVASEAQTLDEIILELRETKSGERASRAQDQENAYAMQKLRTEGYM